jgi:hypothetical protein
MNNCTATTPTMSSRVLATSTAPGPSRGGDRDTGERSVAGDFNAELLGAPAEVRRAQVVER